MKKILSLVLALALVLAASAAFADVPGNIKDIEGLPEMPEVPTMTTSVSGTTETIVVSEKLNWLSWVVNWQYNPIEWSEDGLTGTFSLKNLTLQPGYGGYCNDDVYDYGTDYWSYAKGEDYGETGSWFYKYDADGNRLKDWTYYHEIDTRKHVGSFDPGYVIGVPVMKSAYWHDEDGYRHWYKYVDVKTSYVEMDEVEYPEVMDKFVTPVQEALAKEYPAYADDIYSTGWADYHSDGVEAMSYSEEDFHFGYYDLGATVGNSDDFYRRNTPVYQGMAFDGQTANGDQVKYDRFGRPIAVTSTLTGVNFLNMENEPVKTEVTWGVSVTQYGRKWYIASIKAYIDDETAVEAGFASGGKLLKVK